MNFREAKEKLAQLSGGKYHSLQYQLTEISPGKLEQECSLYIDKGKWISGATWDIAFQKLDIELGLLNPEIENIEELEER